MNKAANPAKWLILLAFTATYVIWGTTYLAIVLGLKTFTPFIMALVRFLIAGSVLLIISLVRKEKLFVSTVLRSMLLGAVILGGGQGTLFWAEKYISSGYAAILVSTLPLWFVVMDKRQWHHYFHNKYIIGGIALGFIGILLLFKNNFAPAGAAAFNHMQTIAVCAMIGSCICWSAGAMYHKYQPVKGTSIYHESGWQLIGGMLTCLIVSLITGEWNSFSFAQVTPSSWWSVIYLAVAGSLGAFVAYNWLLTVRPPAVVGTYAYVNPVIAVLLGCLIANEKVDAWQLAGMFVILLAALLVNIPKYQSLK
jgi:drug/metabolite transporter (DMT)-like permease